jgi:hypothetical protein
MLRELQSLTLRRTRYYSARTVPLPFLRRHRASLIPLAFALPFVTVLLRFALIGAGAGEPYPAISMPPFRGTVSNAEGIVNVSVVEIDVVFADKSVAHPTLAALLAPMPRSIVARAAQNFRATPTHPVPPRVGVKDWLVDRIVPIRTIRYRRAATGNPPQPDTKQWLRETLQRLYLGKPVERIEFHWYRNAYRLREHSLQPIGRVRSESYQIDLRS